MLGSYPPRRGPVPGDECMSNDSMKPKPGAKNPKPRRSSQTTSRGLEAYLKSRDIVRRIQRDSALYPIPGKPPATSFH